MKSIIVELKSHLYQDIAFIVFNYFGIIEAMWSEQNITSKERDCADFLLGRLTMPLGSDSLQIQPWFIGPGAELIRWLIYKNYPEDKVHRLPKSSVIEFDFPLIHFQVDT